MLEGIIYKAMSGFYYVKYQGDTGAAGDIYMCVARGSFRHTNMTPLVGDRVMFNVTEQGKGILTGILPRKNEFIRPPLANVSKMVIVASAAIPVTDPFLVDRMTVIALNNNCKPIICINKLDISDTDELCSIYKTTGFPLVRTSAATNDGIDDLKAELTGSNLSDVDICAFCGNSGVGKSSIINAIDPEYSILTGDVSIKLGRGRHTTRHIELYELRCHALVADTPGFSAFDTGYIAAKEDMQHLFPEFKSCLNSCRFDDCAHINEPGCAVIEAVEQGNIHRIRHGSYKRLYKQALEHKAWKQCRN